MSDSTTDWVAEDLALDLHVYGTCYWKYVDGKKVRVHPLDIRYIKGEPRDSSNTVCSFAKHEVTAKPGEKP
jgi:hypothetical protein